MKIRAGLFFAAAVMLTGCNQGQTSVGTNIEDAHANAADAIDNKAAALDNKADAMRVQAKATRQWGKDLKKEADKIQSDGGHPDQKALNEM